jgi:mono/diheme cytochrome c family protein
MCHSIGGGPLAGPDLAGMNERRERSWLVRFIVDPQAVVASGDAAAQEMVDQYQGMVMPALPGMTSERAAALIDYVAQQSSPAGSSTEAQQPAAQEPFTAAELELGRKLFRGEQALESGGAACLACHDVAALEGLGGGRLGPNLSNIYSRLGGRQGLEPWLSAPPTPTMSSLYRTRPLSEQEIQALAAYFEDRAADEGAADSAGSGSFLLLGVGGSVLLLSVFHLVWRERFRGVRRRLVENYRMRGVQ